MLLIIFYMASLCLYYRLLMLKVTHRGSLTQKWAVANLEACLLLLGKRGQALGEAFGLEGQAVNSSRPKWLCVAQLSAPC